MHYCYHCSGMLTVTICGKEVDQNGEGGKDFGSLAGGGRASLKGQL